MQSRRKAKGLPIRQGGYSRKGSLSKGYSESKKVPKCQISPEEGCTRGLFDLYQMEKFWKERFDLVGRPAIKKCRQRKGIRVHL